MPAKEITNEAPKHVSSVMKISEWKQQMMETMAMDDDLAKLLYYDSSDALWSFCAGPCERCNDRA